MNENKMIELQMQLKQNQSEMMEFVNDLDSWGATMKEKEELLKTDKPTNQPGIPAVRNTLTKKRKKKKLNPQSDKNGSETPKKIRSYDYKAWDKFDVDKACAEVDEEKKESSSDYETDEEAEMLRKRQLANDLKEQGNSLFKSGKYDEAIESYTRAIEIDPDNAILVGNRAMALIKMERYGVAELDCTTAISLDPTFVKVYARRGMARMAMKKYQQAEEDFKQVIKLEPNNKQARTELNTIHQLLNPIPELAASLDICDKGIVSPVYKSPAERSKKPLKRILIEEIGIDESKQTKAFREKAKLSEMNPIIKKDLLNFDKFVSETSTIGLRDPSSNVGMDESGFGDIGETVERLSRYSNKSSVSSDKHELQADERAMQHNGLTYCNNSNPATVCSDETTSTILPLPKNSFQFQADWKTLKSKSDEFYLYMKQINPENYSRIFGEALDADMLSKIFNTLNKYYIIDKVDVYPALHHLTSVKRFGTISMFLSNSDKEVLKELFDNLRSSGQYTDQVIDSLAKAYSL